ncbi:MAG: EAL domain-containing protein [Erythrobacter sp.]
MEEQNSPSRAGSADRDLIALGIATSAIILLVATGSSAMPRVVEAIVGNGKGPDNLLANALLLNIALVVFGWRRYRQLTSEMSIRKRAEAQARDLADTDPLTGCLNRRKMAEVSDQVREDARNNDEIVAFVMIDVDNFKQINDMHGHSVGDQVLVMIANRLREELPHDAKLARLGGDEFGFIAPFDPKSPGRIDDLILRLFEKVTPSFELEGISLENTISIGVASDADALQGKTAIPDSDELMHRADIAMYHAKKQGKNRQFWFEPTMEAELRFRNKLEVGIRRGIANREFVPFYEQQIDLETGELVGFEMLARWHSPQLGLVNPDIFIPIAEEIGTITDISDQLMKQAFRDATEWDNRLTLSINVSPVQLRDPWFAQKLLKLLVEYNMPPKRLEVEITESCLHDNIGMVRSMITSLRNQGVKISLDDFGTGYSSLEQLRTLPFDRLKIDRSFVRELKDADAPSTIVDAIVSLGRGLDMPITAEGIEDEKALAALRQMGPLKGQGYLYGRPEPIKLVRERLRSIGLLVEQQSYSDEQPTESDATLLESADALHQARAQAGR